MTAWIVVACFFVGYSSIGILTAYLLGKHGEPWHDAIDGFVVWPVALPWLLARMAFDAGRRKR